MANFAPAEYLEEARALADRVWDGRKAFEELLELFGRATEDGYSPYTIVNATTLGDAPELVKYEPGHVVFAPTSVYREVKKLRAEKEAKAHRKRTSRRAKSPADAPTKVPAGTRAKTGEGTSRRVRAAKH
jgi:hypothetical protein